MPYIVPLLHPAYIMRGQWAHDPLQSIYLARAKAIAETGRYEALDVETLPPNANIFPTLSFAQEFLTQPGDYTVDIETAGDHLICIGILRTSDEAYICLRFRQQGGSIYKPDELEARAELLFRFLAEPTARKTFHYGANFDIPMLERLGFTVNGYHNDTITQGHLTYTELPRSLVFLAMTFCDIPDWKSQTDVEDEKEESL